MKPSSSLLRGIPGISQLLCLPQAQELAKAYTPGLAAKALRTATDNLRAAILAGQEITPDAVRLIREAGLFLQQEEKTSHRALINATGILLHTNLGRAPMALCAGEAARQAAIHYTNLEFDCLSGSRGDRLVPTQELLKEILRAQDALVVNNNAAAVLLILSSLAHGREVIVSRGELVEIGGSFRVPDVMAQ
ncbi:MAG: L-seryl-tRNA(Sec) selenium transferase, partial [Clostridiales bacterium]|nr:L-seryl-tRNA(Sec) selenium transferase [Clostridiales bacterium]